MNEYLDRLSPLARQHISEALESGGVDKLAVPIIIDKPHRGSDRWRRYSPVIAVLTTTLISVGLVIHGISSAALHPAAAVESAVGVAGLILSIGLGGPIIHNEMRRKPQNLVKYTDGAIV